MECLRRMPTAVSGSTVGLVFYPVGEPSHPGMVPQRFHGVVATLEVSVADGEVYVAVAGSAQGDSLGRITPPEFLPTLPPALHLPGAGARQDVVTGKTVLPNASATELAHPVSTGLDVFAFHHLRLYGLLTPMIQSVLPTYPRA